MFKRILGLTIVSLGFAGSVSAYDMDNYIRDHYSEYFNEESPNSRDAYTEAAELFDEKEPISPEIPFD